MTFSSTMTVSHEDSRGIYCDKKVEKVRQGRRLKQYITAFLHLGVRFVIEGLRQTAGCV